MNPLTRHAPPRKRPGQGRILRSINGTLLDVRSGSIFLGWSEKKMRGLIERGLIPHRRLGARIIFIRAELEAWLANLPGCTAEEARANADMRGGGA